MLSPDEADKVSPAKSKVVHPPANQPSRAQVWSDQAVSCLIDAHPDMLRALPELAASCGMREGELAGVALEDFDFDEKIVRVRRQVKNLAVPTYSLCLRAIVNGLSRSPTGL